MMWKYVVIQFLIDYFFNWVAWLWTWSLENRKGQSFIYGEMSWGTNHNSAIGPSSGASQAMWFRPLSQLNCISCTCFNRFSCNEHFAVRHLPWTNKKETQIALSEQLALAIEKWIINIKGHNCYEQIMRGQSNALNITNMKDRKSGFNYSVSMAQNILINKLTRCFPSSWSALSIWTKRDLHRATCASETALSTHPASEEFTIDDSFSWLDENSVDIKYGNSVWREFLTLFLLRFKAGRMEKNVLGGVECFNKTLKLVFRLQNYYQQGALLCPDEVVPATEKRH
jgi:hypothetical protein